MRPVTELQRTAKPFEIISPYSPSGDQPAAIVELTGRLWVGGRDIVLPSATRIGKSATIVWFVEQTQRPIFVPESNKTPVTQTATKFRELPPNNAVERFVSHHDYYQPEAHVPQTNIFVERDSSTNGEVECLRHSTTNSLLTRRDIIVVSPTSCIYGLGTPQKYVDRVTPLEVDQQIDRDDLLRCFIPMQYARNGIDSTRGTFRVRGDTVEIISMYEELAIYIGFFGNEIEALATLHPVTGDVIDTVERVFVSPASRYMAGLERMQRAIEDIKIELAKCLVQSEHNGRLLEAQHLCMHTTYDLEILQQIGMCSRIENCSLHTDGCETGTPPSTLLDYFPEDFLLVIDKLHVVVPQIGAMYEGDTSRKRTLVEHGLRLFSTLDNRLLIFTEFEDRIGQTIYLLVALGDYETQCSDNVTEQIIRPTGLVDPKVVVKPTQGRIDDLLEEIRVRVEHQERILVTTLIKRMAKDLTTYLAERDMRVEYLHSDVDALWRVELLRELRLGRSDVPMGINPLREDLDLSEVSFVSILDAGKEGLLRPTRSLVQTIGHATRNVSGKVHMYADTITPAMAEAIEKTERRRAKQLTYNAEYNIDPQPLHKRIASVIDMLAREDVDTAGFLAGGYQGHEDPSVQARRKHAVEATVHEKLTGAAQGGLVELISELTQRTRAAAEGLHFELAAWLRDEIQDLKKELRTMWATD